MSFSELCVLIDAPEFQQSILGFIFIYFFQVLAVHVLYKTNRRTALVLVSARPLFDQFMS